MTIKPHCVIRKFEKYQLNFIITVEHKNVSYIVSRRFIETSSDEIIKELIEDQLFSMLAELERIGYVNDWIKLPAIDIKSADMS